MTEQATIATLEGQPVKADFPLHVVMFGIECVCIPEVKYRALIRPAARTVKRSQRLSRLDKDPEVRDYIAARLGQDDVERIRLAAIERFGESRVPSRSALGRFVVQWRAEGRRDGR